MNSILDSMMNHRAFLPENVTEYTALQLAKKLGDADRVLQYTSLFYRHALQTIIEAFTNSQAHPRDNAAAAFEEELRRLTGKETGNDL